ncbi:MAG TPA: hypothetical protein VFU82_05775 [Gammaproteobacteria bacterium]|nr:hypothetical protein [Gammaproteobacteria bacterium]
MSKLSKRQESFVELMLENEDQARYGFSLINSKDNLLDFYDALDAKGFFDYERVITTGAHDYLQKAMSKSALINNDKIIKKIVSRLHKYTEEAELKKQDAIHENYWIVFAKVFSEVPPSYLLEKDIQLVGKWLAMISSTLTDGGIITKLIPSLLASAVPADHYKACMLLNYCIDVKFVEDKFTKKKEPKFKLSDYCVESLFKNLSKEFGLKCGKEVSNVLINKLKKLISDENGRESWVWLPAIEDHRQNEYHDECKPVLTLGLRDIIAAWFSSSIDSEFVVGLLESNVEVFERLAIFIFAENFVDLNSLFERIINPNFIKRNHIHEIYHLLNRRFTLFTEEQRESLINCIMNLPLPQGSKDPAASKTCLQQRMLHAAYQKGSQRVDELYLLLESEIGPVPSHPDFYVYLETWQSNDSSPYDVKELINFLDKGMLVDQLNTFNIKDEFRGPNIYGLVRVLEEAIKSYPDKFLMCKDGFLRANPAYQYGYIKGYFELWTSKQKPLNQYPSLWIDIWAILFDYFDELVLGSYLWNEIEEDKGDLIPKKSWIPRLIADFLRSGMHADDNAFSEDLLPRAKVLICNFLSNLPSESRWHEKDSMTIAINSSKGKAIEALVYYALRTSRLSQQKVGSHNSVWLDIEPVFNEELSKCKSDNFEFSTLMASYIENLRYLSNEWLVDNLAWLFPTDHIQNFSSAIQGLAYTNGASPEVYCLLRDQGVFEFAIKEHIANGQIKKQLIDRIALAYLWDLEKLDSGLFAFLYENNYSEELGLIARFYWSIQNQKITNDDKSKIINFWRQSINWCKSKQADCSSLLSSLGMLACYLDELDEEKKQWMLLSAKHIVSANNEMHFLEDLHHLTDKSPGYVLDVLEEMLKYRAPHYDIGNHLKNILTKMGDADDEDIRRRNLVICDKLRNLPGFQKLYESLTAGI